MGKNQVRMMLSSRGIEVADLGSDVSSPSGSYVGGRLNINLANVEELQTLSGIGPSTAEKIVADREANGPFPSIEDLMRVSGIGEKKFAAIKDSICAV